MKIKWSLVLLMVMVGVCLLSGCKTTESAVAVNKSSVVPASDNIIEIRDEITDYTRQVVVAKIFQLIDQKDVSTIEIRISSPGGEIGPAMEICNAMKYAQKFKTVKTVAVGETMSAAALILSCGTKGQRYVGAYALIMIHDPWIQAQIVIQPKRMKEINEYYEQTTKTYYLVLSENTGKTIEQIREDCFKEQWLTAEEAINYGLADHIW